MQRIYKDINIKYGIIDPSIRTRKSVSYSQYIMDIIDTFPSWSKFPKRSKSISMLNGSNPQFFNPTGNNVDTYSVYLTDNINIGVCPYEDLNFYSWPMIENVFEYLHGRSPYGRTITESEKNNPINLFILLFGILDHRLTKNFNIEVIENRYEEFCHIYKYMDKNNMFIFYEPFYRNDDKYNSVDFKYTFDFITDKIKEFGNIFNWLDKELFNPEKNGFYTVTSSSKIPKNCEVWTDGICLLKNLNN